MESHLRSLSEDHKFPKDHVAYLKNLKSKGFEPKVIYDIGCCLLHWTNIVKELWPEAAIYMFDAFAPAEFLYKESGFPYHLGVLSDKDDKVVDFYQNDFHPGGNSYYREIGTPLSSRLFTDQHKHKCNSMTLDTIVKQRGFPLPDFVKLDTQGSEKDIMIGGQNVISHAEYIILEAQHTDYNLRAPKSKEVIDYMKCIGYECVAERFAHTPCDADYAFRKFSLNKQFPFSFNNSSKF
jgi:FkbM family methyltransferase